MPALQSNSSSSSVSFALPPAPPAPRSPSALGTAAGGAVGAAAWALLGDHSAHPASTGEHRAQAEQRLRTKLTAERQPFVWDENSLAARACTWALQLKLLLPTGHVWPQLFSEEAAGCDALAGTFGSGAGAGAGVGAAPQCAASGLQQFGGAADVLMLAAPLPHGEGPRLCVLGVGALVGLACGVGSRYGPLLALVLGATALVLPAAVGLLGRRPTLLPAVEASLTVEQCGACRRIVGHRKRGPRDGRGGRRSQGGQALGTSRGEDRQGGDDAHGDETRRSQAEHAPLQDLEPRR
eukprot:CAMPEP_0179122536 /NCGR_PEP_ID=MMETSP0796-20121207/57835_1 /TAXON_ID=73915 /ORGANISM="Pyrodinium bahamense, Strain pbaha01" /LENGTH=294 /DNA_ID=CAMNT_0020821159 /DNA_START=316 /DNA_END=1196 /DNA_ORIENTATION=-